MPNGSAQLPQHLQFATVVMFLADTTKRENVLSGMKCVGPAIILLAIIWEGAQASNYDPRCADQLPTVCDRPEDLQKYTLDNGECARTSNKVGNVSHEDQNWPIFFKFLKCAKSAGINANQVPHLHAGLQRIVEESTLQKPCSAVRHICREWSCDLTIPAGHCWRDGKKCWKYMTELNTDLKPSKCWKNILQVDKRELLKNHSSVVYQYIAYCGAPDVAFRRKLGHMAEDEQFKVTGMAAVTSFCQNIDKWILRFGYPVEADDTTTIMDLNVVVFHFMVFLIGMFVILHSYWIAVRAKNWLREKCEQVRQDSRRKWTIIIKEFKERKEEERKKAHPKVMDMEDCERMPGNEAAPAGVKSKTSKNKSKSKTTTKKSGLKRLKKGAKSVSKDSKTTGKRTKKGKKSKTSKSRSKTTGYRRPKTKAQIIKETREKAQAILDRQKRRKEKESKLSKDKKPADHVEEQKTQESEHVVAVGNVGSKNAQDKKQVPVKNGKPETAHDVVVDNTQESDETCKSRSVKAKDKKRAKKATNKKTQKALSEKTARDSEDLPVKKETKAAPKKVTGDLSEKTAVDSEADRKDNKKSAHEIKDAPKKRKADLSEKTAVDSEVDKKESKVVTSGMSVHKSSKNKSKKGKKGVLPPAPKTVANTKPQDQDAKTKDNKEKKSAAKGQVVPKPKKQRDSKEFLSERTAVDSEAEKKATDVAKLGAVKPKSKDSTVAENKSVENKQQVAAPVSNTKDKVAAGPKKSSTKKAEVGKAEGNNKVVVADQAKKAEPANVKKGKTPKKK